MLRKVAVVALFVGLSRDFLGGTEENHEEPQTNQCSRRYSKRSPSEYNSKALVHGLRKPFEENLYLELRVTNSSNTLHKEGEKIM
jgi:hypothetical protein